MYIVINNMHFWGGFLAIILLNFINISPAIAYTPEGRIITFNITHTPPEYAHIRKPLRLTVIIYEPDNVAIASVGYRSAGESEFRTLLMKRNGAIFEATLPPENITGRSIEYFIFVIDTNGIPHTVFRNHRKPQQIKVLTGEPGESATEIIPVSSFTSLSDQKVTSASRHLQSMIESPGYVSVITDSEILTLGLFNLPEILRYTAGTDVRGLNPALYNVGIRGYANRNNLLQVRVDGREVDLRPFKIPDWYGLQTALGDIKKVEIINGPASSLYGSNAFSGVINIYTKNAEDMERFKTDVRAGERFSLFSYAGSGVRLNGFGAKLSTEYGQLESWEKPDEKVLNTTQVNSAIWYNFGRDTISSLRFGHARNRTPFFTYLGDFYSRADSWYLQTELAVRDFLIQAYWVENRIEYFKGSGDLLLESPSFRTNLPPLPARSDALHLYSHYSLYTGNWNRLMIGGEFKSTVFSPSDTPEMKWTQNNFGTFFSNELRPFEELLLFLSYRFDWDSITPQANSLSGGIVIIPARTNSFSLTYRNGYRSPSFVEYRQSQTELSIEEISSYQINYTGIFNSLVELNLSLFYNRLKNFIEFIPSENIYKNLPENADTFGGEAGGRLLINKWLTSFLNYSLVLAKDRAGNIDANYVHPDDSNPNHRVNAGILLLKEDGPFGSLAVSFTSGFHEPLLLPGVENSSRSNFEIKPVKSYALLNLKTGYSMLGGRLKFGFYGSNLLFQRHLEASKIIWNSDSDRDGISDSRTNFRGEEVGTRLMGFITATF